jgi:hypothetical protein
MGAAKDTFEAFLGFERVGEVVATGGEAPTWRKDLRLKEEESWWSAVDPTGDNDNASSSLPF